jgi:predicted DNA-binding WGR domain protein
MNYNNINRESLNNGNIKNVYLENREEGHYKFYIISRKKSEKDTWLAQWGRIGNNPQKKTYSYTKKKPWDQLNEKLKKGYKIINSDTFESIMEETINETLEYMRSVGVFVDSLDDILL